MSKKTVKQWGFSLVELVVALAVIGILAVFSIPAYTGIPENAIEKRKQDNASEVTKLVLNARAAGASVGADASNDIDTTSMTTLLADLATGVTADSQNFQWVGTALTADSYTVSASGIVTPVAGSAHRP